MSSTEDRRDSTSRVEFSDGNGTRTVVYSFSIKRANAVVGLVLGVLALAGVVFGSVRVGVETVVHQEFEHQLADPRSDLNRHIDSRFAERCTLSRADTNLRLRAVEQHVAVIAEQNRKQAEELAEVREDLREILRRTSNGG